jgi:glyoxylase-like metal-dependent hydrolase (beta-lactamase superfamily II)
MKLIPLIADQWKMDGGVAFGVVPKSIWNRNLMADENNMMPIVTRCLLIRDSGRNILIDAGMGDKRDEKYYKVRYRVPSVTLLKSLEDAGVAPEEITDVILTHLHDDHVGGLTTYRNRSIELVFPNSVYYCSKAHWDWAINPNKREAASFFPDNLMPLSESGKLHFIENEGELFSNIFLRIYNGHTIGQLIPFIHTGDKVVVYMGDFIPTVFNIPLPFVPSVDVQPLVSMDEKAAFLAEALEKSYMLMFEHDSFNECCTLKQTEKGVVMDKSFSLSEIIM